MDANEKVPIDTPARQTIKAFHGAAAATRLLRRTRDTLSAYLQSSLLQGRRLGEVSLLDGTRRRSIHLSLLLRRLRGKSR